MAANLQKLKLLYIAKMLVEETDAVAGLTMAQILERLEAHGITAERKSVYRDIESLREFGLDIQTFQRAPLEYALVTRSIELDDLMLIVDAVQSSRHLTQRKSDALVRSIKRLAPKRERDLLDRHLSVSGRIKIQGDSLLYNVDRILEAIAGKRKACTTWSPTIPKPTTSRAFALGVWITWRSPRSGRRRFPVKAISRSSGSTMRSLVRLAARSSTRRLSPMATP